MRNQRWVEVSVGGFMLLGLLALVFLAFKVSGLTYDPGRSNFEVEAFFGDIGGLKPRSKVTLAGVVVGRVTSIELDEEWFEARVVMQLDERLKGKLSLDTAAAIQTSGLLGDNYISLTPGIDDEMLVHGGTLRDTQSALILEQLINQFITNSTRD
ncbi:outer membrane lipid asymmetry maintenance protein MlaD [Marinospirillum alkaliphilum]|uniref:Phospholipid/cholesterol/gamma-HCH transport system substrate-binding protein n=1 Tax=Marinospirillum alkaliphilum DSM 21637 TaxID=1122209 RepID=A0A1K1TPT3_9GAMM|nr:outer membrane lipid asymmetry maintenance protein MlaD [Marinospirillum alkaliphilum]SFX02309.1 phospholipid/cholesterol/gamma-HCH transport system substrate-binding protein [Marinospirillum alkaliphilum DSM 21637]